MALATMTLAATSMGQAGCGNADVATSTVAIGAVLDRTGTLAATSWVEAATLAVADANQALQQSGRVLRFKLEVSDSTNTPKVASQRALELVQQKGVRGIVTDSSQDDIALNAMFYDADTTNDLNVPIVCMACTSPAINNPASSNPADAVNQATLRNGLHWNFRALMDAMPQAKVFVRIAQGKAVSGDVNGDGLFKLAVYYSDEAFGRGFADALKVTVAALSLPIPTTVELISHPATVDPNTYDCASDVKRLVDNNNETTMAKDGLPDLVSFVTFPQFVSALAKSYGINGNGVPVLHTHVSRFPSVLRVAGSSLAGQEGTSHISLEPGASGSAFASSLRTATGIDPQFLDANTYDGTVALLLASAYASRTLADPSTVTGEQVRKAMSAINDPKGTVVRPGPTELAKAFDLIAADKPINYEGASGPLDFSADGNVVNKLVLWRASATAFTEQSTYDCVGNPDCPKTP
jgi:branched-chain amino acid transport system substrate-binding protein